MDTLIQLTSANGTSFVFQNLEIPEDINFGGEQKLVQHNLIGGNRVIDSLGKNDIDITWKGRMYGSDALTRAQSLNQLRAGGQQLVLNWFTLSYNVVIQNFVSYTERYYNVRYEITLKVISDGANPLNIHSLVGFNEAINGDLTTANQLAANVNNSSVNSSMQTLTSAIQAVPTFNGAAPSLIATITAPLNSAISAVEAAIAPLANRLFGTSS
jgi:hypothetical protein